MSKLICSSAITGAINFVKKAEEFVAEAIKQKGKDCPVAFPSTTYYLPVIYSFTGKKMETLADLQEILADAKNLLPAQITDELWLPYLGQTLDAGVATLFACEVIEACKYIIGPNPVDGIYLGAANDVIMRERGIEFVDGSAPGFAAITGAAPDSKTAAKIAKELQQKNLYVFMGGSTNGVQFADQLAEEGVQLGWETRLVPFGKDVSSLIYALGFANRAALSFGGIKPGDFKANLEYNKSRVFAFVIALGEVDEEKYAAAAGAINYGFPVIADTDIPEILPTGVCTYEHVVANVPHDTIVEKALEVRGCKIKIVDVPIPVAYGAAFEGERIRKENTQAEFGGNKTTAFEFVTSVDPAEINDGEIVVIGKDIDEIPEGGSLPLGIWVEVAGRKMQSDFEPILERQIHHLVNGAEGIWHMGQRDIVWTRISKDAFAKGLRVKDYGEIIHARFMSDYPAIVDKVKVTLVTDPEEVEKRLQVAKKVYDERNRRLEAMTDESVDTFYSCLLCQSFAPNHVCVITPERLGLCGAYNWLDGKAAYEIDELGPNQPLNKGECLDPVKGVWSGVNEYVYTNSHKAIKAFSAYSIMDRPMTSCGCFEAIVAYLPECNGVMVVNREYLQDTPVGMTFSTLAGSVGGGAQTPGFIGVGKVFLTSRKFIHAEGGFKRLVWMPKELKEQLYDDLKKRYDEQGIGEWLDKLADETVCTTADDLRAYLEKINHPVLEMEDMANYAEQGDEEEAPVAAAKVEEVIKEEAKEAEKPAEGLSMVNVEEIKTQLMEEVRSTVIREIVENMVSMLTGGFTGVAPVKPIAAAAPEVPKKKAVTTASKVDAIKSFKVAQESNENKVWTVKLGNTKVEGGTRSVSYTVGGHSCMPYHLWEGQMPNKPLVAMEVFDRVSEKYPDELKGIYKDLLDNPAKMAKALVDEYGAELISVRLDGTHPERGNRSVEQSVELVKSVLDSVGVPLIITGHNHFDKNNEVMKTIASACEGENLLFNWVEQDNYRTIAGACVAYGHSVVAQSPIDVNIGKQLNILLNNMDLKLEKIIMDPMTSSIGYGIEYTYSIIERVRLTGLGGDKMLCAPIITSPGYECARAKEYRAPQSAFPLWGDLAKRTANWELATAISLLEAGADVLVMYHPEAAKYTKAAIADLLDGK